MIVDSHGHLVPAVLLDIINKERSHFPSVRIIEQGGNVAFSFAGGKPTRPVAKGLIDVAGRTAWMDKQVIDRQVVGGWPDIFAYELPIEGERWCRLTNAARRHRAIAIRSMIRQLSIPTISSTTSTSSTSKRSP
jgi:aminocarboxymuconate-semialdehyde decarboxylase